jgi:hypothetical protein
MSRFPSSSSFLSFFFIITVAVQYYWLTLDVYGLSLLLMIRNYIPIVV